MTTKSHEPLSGANPSKAILADADQKIVRPITVNTITIGLSNRSCNFAAAIKPKA